MDTVTKVEAPKQMIAADQELINSLVLNGDLSKMTAGQKVQYYKLFCDRLGLDPLTQPFKILKLQGKEILYCDRSGAQQLNKLHSVSHEVRSRELIEAAGVFQVTARASLTTGRYTDAIGAVNLTYPEELVWFDRQGNRQSKPHPKAGKLMQGDDYANAIMKAETKAKRRATLDLLGLGIMDETEAETLVEVKGEPIQVEQPKDNGLIPELHVEYMTCLNELISIQGDEAMRYHPDNWRKERSADNYQKAIAEIKKMIERLNQPA